MSLIVSQQPNTGVELVTTGAIHAAQVAVVQRRLHHPCVALCEVVLCAQTSFADPTGTLGSQPTHIENSKAEHLRLCVVQGMGQVRVGVIGREVYRSMSTNGLGIATDMPYISTDCMSPMVEAHMHAHELPLSPHLLVPGAEERHHCGREWFAFNPRHVAVR